MTFIESNDGQSKQMPEKFTNFNFYCYSNLDSILLPSDFHGPDYFQYEEGSIISFKAHDTCIVSILCGGNMFLNLDSTYIRIDTMVANKYRHKIYYSRVKNRYARQDYTRNFFIMYENATEQRKLDLDKIFDLFRQE